MTMVIVVLAIAVFIVIIGMAVAQYYLMWLGMRKGLNLSKLRASIVLIIFFILNIIVVAMLNIIGSVV